MANIHVLAVESGALVVACHIPVPNVANSVPGGAITFPIALVNSGSVSVSRMKPGNGTLGTIDNTPTTGEVDQLAAGTLYEVIQRVPLNDFIGLAPAAKLARLDDAFNSAKQEVQAMLQTRFAFFGFSH